MDMKEMTPRRPYLARAFYDWLADNDLTPHIVVDAMMAGVRVPFEFVKDGQIILNVAPRAVGNFEISNDAITFNARFSGKPHLVYVPMYALQAIYARENGAGTMFEPEDAYANIAEANIAAEDVKSSLTSVESNTSSTCANAGNKDEKSKNRPSLKIVK